MNIRKLAVTLAAVAVLAGCGGHVRHTTVVHHRTVVHHVVVRHVHHVVIHHH